MAKKSKDTLIKTLSPIPASLAESDIKDMFAIVEQHFIRKTPRSINYFCHLFFQVSPESEPSNEMNTITDLSGLLCLPVSVKELLSSFKSKNSQDDERDNLRYFVVDCRPAEEYNNGHLSTAFHLDCSLVSGFRLHFCSSTN